MPRFTLRYSSSRYSVYSVSAQNYDDAVSILANNLPGEAGIVLEDEYEDEEEYIELLDKEEE